VKFNFSEDIKNICREVFRRNQVDYFDPEDETTRTPKYQKWERKHPNLFKDPAERVLLRQLVNFERSIIAPLSWTVKECEGVTVIQTGKNQT